MNFKRCITLTMGVMKHCKNPSIASSDGQNVWKKLMTRPLMCDPTWSWSGSCCIFGSPIGTQCENRGCLNKHCCVEDFDTP